VSNEGRVRNSRGQFQFYKVSKYLVDDIMIDDGGINQYLFSFTGCIDSAENKSVISNLNLSGQKDGVKMLACKGFKITNLTTSTLDDGLSIVSSDYNISMPTVGDCSDWEVDGWDDLPYAGAYGGCVLFMNDSWEDWVTGTAYDYQEGILHGGQLYRKQSLGTETSTVAPTHTSGIVITADGISWMWIMATELKSTTVKDGVIKNVNLTGYKYFAGFSVDGFMNNKQQTAVYDNIVFDNITQTAGAVSVGFIINAGIIDTLTIQNSNLNGYGANAAAHTTVKLSKNTIGESHASHIIFDNCNIDHSHKPTFLDCVAGSTLDKITFKNGYLKHAGSSQTLCILKGVNQLTDFIIDNSTLETIGNLISSNVSNLAVEITATNTYFKTPYYIIYLQTGYSG